jgi:Recombination endonuclease VII
MKDPVKSRAAVKKYRQSAKGKATKKVWLKSHPDPRKGKRHSDMVSMWRRKGVDINTVPTWKAKGCAICQSPDSICMDHDHKTGKFRGWLCRSCNTVLGYVKDSPGLLRLLALYLEAE